MNCSFKYKFNKWNYITLILMCVAVIPLSIVNVLRLFEVGNLISINKGLEIISVTVSMLIVAFVVVVVIISRYTITDEFVTVQVVMRAKIAVKDILLMRKDIKSNLLVMYYMDKKLPPADPVNFMVICINDKDKMPFVECLRTKNPRVIFELFDKDGNNDNKPE
ncbi:MAG: hypothetical protein EOM87_08140 [Clostridia bacterium]|nr:hypothetical protein [Clostridia bacterium]